MHPVYYPYIVLVQTFYDYVLPPLEAKRS